MKKLKKFIAIVMALVMSLSLCACGGTTTNSTTDQNVNEDGTLSGPSFKNTDKTEEDTDTSTKAPDLNDADGIIASFKRTNPVTANHAMGQAFIDSGLYASEDDFPTNSEIYANMLDNVTYEYDVNTHYLTVSGDLDTASLNTLAKYVVGIDNHFGYYDRLYFTGEWEFYKINNAANGIYMNYATLATVDQYGETPLEYYSSMIMLCSEMKNGKIDWDQASSIYDEFMQIISVEYE